jgi:formylglycine-generating enzyme required for sulfatase activity
MEKPSETKDEIPKSMPPDLWQTCWSGSCFDFTQDAWVNLGHSRQFEYGKAYQAWYAKTKGLNLDKIVEKNGARFEFRLIPPGKFWMGSNDAVVQKIKEFWRKNNFGNYDETRHRVLISKPFYIGKTEVTQAQWQAAMGNDPPDAPYCKNVGKDAPIENVSWEHCQKFCQKAKGLCLPTEAQWEYACRGGVTAAYCFDDSESEVGDYAWYSNSTTHPVGQKQANAWGVYDMHGNVWEWCQDYYGDYAESADLSGIAENPAGPQKGSLRVSRGGSWHDRDGDCRAALRGGNETRRRYGNLGARLVLSDH